MGVKGPEGSPILSSLNQIRFNCHRGIPIQKLNSQFCLIDYRIPAFVPIESLVNFRFSATEVKRLYWSFKSECPSGMVNQESFHAIYSKFFPVGGIDIDRFSCKIKSPSFVHSIQPTLAAILIISSLRWITGRAESSILKWLFRHAHLPIYWIIDCWRTLPSACPFYSRDQMRTNSSGFFIFMMSIRMVSWRWMSLEKL